MKKINFRLYSKLSINDTLKRISNLFKHEYVNFSVDLNSIKSTYIPFPILSIDRRMYTRKNWLGFNPFIFISGIEVFFVEVNTTETQVDVCINQDRAIIICLIFLFFLSLILLAIPDLPSPWFGVAFFFSIAFALRFFLFDLCIKRLIKSEILNAIQ